MKALLTLIALSFSLLGSISHANEPPPLPLGGLVPLHEAPCSDMETGERGHCYLQKDLMDNVYMSFMQDDVLMFIRRVIDGGYETIWMNDRYNSF
jgi:hypothetical protein